MVGLGDMIERARGIGFSETYPAVAETEREAFFFVIAPRFCFFLSILYLYVYSPRKSLCT